VGLPALGQLVDAELEQKKHRVNPLAAMREAAA
jgi:hypothetical protein